jgi:UDP-N-acetylglucosamine 2-epimerase
MFILVIGMVAMRRIGARSVRLYCAMVEMVIGDTGPGGGSAGVAACLVEIEQRLLSERPDSVAVVGAGDEALAAALVAGKLLIPIRVVEEGEPEDAAQATNRRLIRLLAGPPAPPTLPSP